MFAGVVSLGEGRAPREIIGGADLLKALCPDHPPDATGTWSNGPTLVVQAKLCGSSADAELWRQRSLPQRCSTTGRVIVWWGRLDNRDELVRELGCAAEASDEELVLAAFARWGADCAERLHGDFAAAVIDPAARRVWLVRDRLGVKPLYHWNTPDTLLFATSAAVLVRLRGASEALDRAWIARELTGAWHDEAATPWSDVARLAPGHWLEVADGEPRLTRYHGWRDDPPWTTQRDPAWVATYRDALEEAVRCRMRGTELIGNEASGGVDSSTVLSYLADFLGEQRARLYAIGLASAEMEGEFIAAASVHARVPWTCLLAPRPAADALSQGLAAVGYPTGAAAAFVPIYEECRRRGIRTLFSGFGGDESVTNSGTLLGRELRDRRAYPALYGILPGAPPARLARLVRAVAIGERWGGGHPRLQAAMAARWPHQLVRDDVVADLGLLPGYEEQAAFDGPYRRINEFVLHNRLRSNISRRLETCTLVAASHGVEYRWPLLDARLVQQWLSTPSIEKASREFGRYLHRRAVDGVVAPKVGWKHSKDMGPVMPGSMPFKGPAPIDEARRVAGDLHPILAEVVDTGRLNTQIAAAEDKKLDENGRFQFLRNVQKLGEMNQWLWGG